MVRETPDGYDIGLWLASTDDASRARDRLNKSVILNAPSKTVSVPIARKPIPGTTLIPTSRETI